MGGGSQLSKLKSTLRDSGLSRTSSPKDVKKRNKKSAASGAHRSAKLEAIGQDFNKFDLREENKKFQVVTRQGKLEEGKKGAPGKSRAAGLEQVSGSPSSRTSSHDPYSAKRRSSRCSRAAPTPPLFSTTASAKTRRRSRWRRRISSDSPLSARPDSAEARRRGSTSRMAMRRTQRAVSRTAAASWALATRRSLMRAAGAVSGTVGSRMRTTSRCSGGEWQLRQRRRRRVYVTPRCVYATTDVVSSSPSASGPRLRLWRRSWPSPRRTRCVCYPGMDKTDVLRCSTSDRRLRTRTTRPATPSTRS